VAGDGGMGLMSARNGRRQPVSPQRANFRANYFGPFVPNDGDLSPKSPCSTAFDITRHRSTPMPSRIPPTGRLTVNQGFWGDP
jgi:hypothetical protein